MRRGPEGMTVSQALPFLKLSSNVRDADGRAASIDWISVDIDGDTPSLVMELTYLKPEREDETCPRFETVKRRRDETVPFELQRPEPTREVVVGGSTVLRPTRPFAEQLHEAWEDLRRDLGRFFLHLAQRLAPV
jgi:hypothetical protein